MHTPDALPEIPVASWRFPIVGHLPWLMFDVHQFLATSRERHGPVYWLNQWMGTWMVVVDGEPGLQLLRSEHGSADRPSENIGYILDDTMLVADGSDHRRMRGAARHPFSPRGLAAGRAGEIVAEVVEARLAGWPEQRRIRLLAETGEIALDVIFRLIGVPVSDLSEWRKAFRTFVLGALPSPGGLPGTPLWRALRARSRIDEQLQTFLDRARADGDTETLLGAMAHSRHDGDDGLTADELIANLRVLGLAGHETSASAMAWSMLHLGTDPERWARLVDEAAASDPPVSPRDLRAFPFAEAVFRECIRLYPPATMLRRTVRGSYTAHGVTLPDGTLVGIPLYTIGMDPERYPDPLSFVPERWLDRDRSPGPGEAFQFGAGAHFCLGYHLALLEGVQFLVRAARLLSDRGLRPRVDRVPSPTYFPAVRPPSSATLLLD